MRNPFWGELVARWEKKEDGLGVVCDNCSNRLTRNQVGGAGQAFRRVVELIDEEGVEFLKRKVSVKTAKCSNKLLSPVLTAVLDCILCNWTNVLEKASLTDCKEIDVESEQESDGVESPPANDDSVARVGEWMSQMSGNDAIEGPWTVDLIGIDLPRGGPSMQQGEGGLTVHLAPGERPQLSVVSLLDARKATLDFRRLVSQDLERQAAVEDTWREVAVISRN